MEWEHCPNCGCGTRDLLRHWTISCINVETADTSEETEVKFKYPQDEEHRMRRNKMSHSTAKRCSRSQRESQEELEMEKRALTELNGGMKRRRG